MLLAGEKGGSYTLAATRYRGDVIPETLARVQARGHGGLTFLKIPSLVSLLWVLTTSCPHGCLEEVLSGQGSLLCKCTRAGKCLHSRKSQKAGVAGLMRN